MGSTLMEPNSMTINKYIAELVKQEVDNCVYKESVDDSSHDSKDRGFEKEFKVIAGVTKLPRECAKKANLYNSKLRDYRVIIKFAFVSIIIFF